MLLATIGLAAALFACTELTEPIRGLLAPQESAKYLNGPGTVVVYPGNMHGWSFYNEQLHAACADSTCTLVSGPTGQPLGTGSAQLQTIAGTTGRSLKLSDYQGVRFSDITQLGYWTYRQSTTGVAQAIMMQMQVDYDLSDADVSTSPNLNYQPGLGSGEVASGTWTHWDLKTGASWWSISSTVIKGGASVTNPCTQSHPCSWTQLLAAFPNIGFHASAGVLQFRAPSGGTANYSGTVDAFSIGINGATTTFDFEQSSPVPPISPRSTAKAVWDSLTAPTNVLVGAPSISQKVVRNALFVLFNPTATAQDRTQAIAAVSGSVVGGVAVDFNPDDGTGKDGYYVVTIPLVPVPGDSSSGPLLRARQLLRSLSQVRRAQLIDLGPISNFYLRPNDGGVFASGYYHARKDLAVAQSATWALDVINAPMGWGCENGSISKPRVAVVDDGLTANGSDFVGNVAPNAELSTGLQIGGGHGTAVASIIGARGNNQQGISGVVWNAQLGYFRTDSIGPATPSDSGPAMPSSIAATMRAIRAGYPVVNLSWGPGFIDTTVHSGPPKLRAPDPKSHGDSDYVQTFAQEMVDAIAAYSSGNSPLIVLAAGNNGMSSFYSLAPMKSLDSSLATRIVVVGGAKASGAALALTDSTNRGQLVDIVAPGEYVPGLSPNGVVGFKFGTSFAAPLVSGVAAALTAFDPTLTASTLKQYLINGAKNGRYQVADVTRTDSIPMLDMYESLKLAATQPGTPLCGNRVWNDGNNQIMAERGNSTEPLFSRPGTDYAAFTNPFHGGRRIEVGFSYQYKYSQSTRDWSQDTYVPAGDSSFGGAYLSYTYAADHDNKIWTTRIDTTDATGQQISVTLVDAGSRNLRKDFGSQHVPFTMPAPPATCIMEYPIGANGNISVPANNFVGYQCTGYAPSGSWSSIATTGGVSLTPIIAVPSPQADFILVPVSVRQQTALYTPLREVCNAADTLNNNITQTDSIRRCANLTFRVDSSLRAFVYRIDTLTGQWRQIPLDDAGNTTREGREINSLSISEDGKQMMLSMTRRVNFSSWLVDDAACHDETLEWIALDSIPGTNKGAGAVLKVVNLPQGKSCGGWVEAGGTVSPFRAPRVSGGAVLTSRSGGSLRSPFAARSARLAVPGAPASEQRSPGARQSVAPPFTSSKSQ